MVGRMMWYVVRRWTEPLPKYIGVVRSELRMFGRCSLANEEALLRTLEKLWPRCWAHQIKWRLTGGLWTMKAGKRSQKSVFTFFLPVGDSYDWGSLSARRRWSSTTRSAGKDCLANGTCQSIGVIGNQRDAGLSQFSLTLEGCELLPNAFKLI